jgi:hypothetical protein
MAARAANQNNRIAVFSVMALRWRYRSKRFLHQQGEDGPLGERVDGAGRLRDARQQRRRVGIVFRPKRESPFV